MIKAGAQKKIIPFNQRNIAMAMETLREHETRIQQLEQTDIDLQEITILLKKVIKYVKVGLPMVASAAVTSGIVSGKWGAFFAALFSQ